MKTNLLLKTVFILILAVGSLFITADARRKKKWKKVRCPKKAFCYKGKCSIKKAHRSQTRLKRIGMNLMHGKGKHVICEYSKSKKFKKRKVIGKLYRPSLRKRGYKECKKKNILHWYYICKR